MKACLAKLGLEVSSESEAPVPSLSRLHLSAAQPSEVSELVHSWHEAGIITKGEDGEEWEMIKGENDVFVLEQTGRWDMGEVKDALPTTSPSDTQTKTEEPTPSAAALIDYATIPKHLLAHETALPDSKETPHFNHHAFFAALHHYAPSPTFGRTLLYGEVVTSTNTLLEKNPKLLSHLPDGLTATATTQLAGRGRGSNVWVSPPGSLMFSTVLRHPLSLSATAPVVFVQYIAALAIVAGIQQYDNNNGGYDKMPIKLKWPNDIYALDPTAPSPPGIPGKEAGGGGDSKPSYVKIGGILVHSSYSGGDYTLVCGIGLNATNPSPTTSLTHLAKQLNLPAPSLEKLLASILTQFEALYTCFRRTGWDGHFEGLYYDAWLHSGQIVTLETEGGARAVIRGISRDWGLLVAEEVQGVDDRPTGRRWGLQSDGNSFDFFRGLLKRKV